MLLICSCLSKRRLAVPIVLLLALLAGPCSVSWSQNLLIEDYRVPVSSASSLVLDMNYHYATLGETEATNQGTVSVVYKSFYESLNYGRSLDLLWSASRNQDANDFDTDLSWRLKRFIDRDRPHFGSVDLQSSYSKGNERPAVRVTLGIGLGRFIDATALVKAARIEDYLLFSGQIYDDLPVQTMIELAQVIEKQQEYRNRYGATYKRLWYEDMTQVIRGSDMLKTEDVDAAHVLRMDQVLFRERVSERFFGWDATLGVNFQVLTSAPSIERATPAADLTVRYSRPISWRAQVNERFSINSPMGSDFGRAYNLLSTTDFSYEITNRIDFVLNYLLRSEKRSEEASAMTSHTFGLLFIFFIENQINLTANVRWTKSTGAKLNQNYVTTLNYRVF